MHILTAIKFTSEVDEIGPMDFLNEDDGNAGLACAINRLAGEQHPIPVARHVVDGTDFACIDEGAGLNVDHDQRRTAFDEITLGFGKVGHRPQAYLSRL